MKNFAEMTDTKLGNIYDGMKSDIAMKSLAWRFLAPAEKENYLAEMAEIRQEMIRRGIYIVASFVNGSADEQDARMDQTEKSIARIREQMAKHEADGKMDRVYSDKLSLAEHMDKLDAMHQICGR